MFLIGINISLVLNIFMRLLDFTIFSHTSFKLTGSFVIVDPIVVILAVISVPIILNVKRKYVLKNGRI